MKARTYVRTVAIECAWAEGIRFERCGFAHLNPSGIGLGPGCRNNAIVGCTIEDIGGNGVMIGWRGVGELADDDSAADWKDPTDAPAGNEVVNCNDVAASIDTTGNAMRNVIKAGREHLADGRSVNGREVVVATFVGGQPYIEPTQRYWPKHRQLLSRCFQSGERRHFYALGDDVVVLLLPSTPAFPRRLRA